MTICPLCDREIPPELESRHHLVPKLKGGAKGETAILHKCCHSKIHSLFTEAELARDYPTIEALRAHPEIAKFTDWLQGKPPSYSPRNPPSVRRRRRMR
ncbi:MAG: hypothetical protein R3F11_23545 [Verrucomicrobiales bacterium]